MLSLRMTPQPCHQLRSRAPGSPPRQYIPVCPRTSAASLPLPCTEAATKHLTTTPSRLPNCTTAGLPPPLVARASLPRLHLRITTSHSHKWTAACTQTFEAVASSGLRRRSHLLHVQPRGPRRYPSPRVLWHKAIPPSHPPLRLSAGSRPEPTSTMRSCAATRWMAATGGAGAQQLLVLLCAGTPAVRRVWRPRRRRVRVCCRPMSWRLYPPCTVWA
mmetsp:Transcript_37349/g.83112  ORF Transcript_37349/g.83112 Transcript_37349/m.83112 type:complete len:217 (+) Transcript_37349:803-1453(+)